MTIFRHKCGDCLCQCEPCNDCNEEDEDLLPETITVSFSFPSPTSAAQELYDGMSLVLQKSYATDQITGCLACRYIAYFCWGLISCDVRFTGIGKSVSLSLFGGSYTYSVLEVSASFYAEGPADCLQSQMILEGQYSAAGSTASVSPGGAATSAPPYNSSIHPTHMVAQWSYAGIAGSYDGPLSCGFGNAFSPFCTGLGNSPYVSAQATDFGAEGSPFSTGLSFFYTCPFVWSVALVFYGETIKVTPTRTWRRAVGFVGSYRGPGIPTLQDFGPLSLDLLAGAGYDFLTVNQWPPALMAQFQQDMANNNGPSLAEWTNVSQQPHAQWTLDF